MPALQREFNDDQIKYVASHPMYQWLLADIDAGNVLPCLRRGEIHFYERGARLISFSRGKFRTDAQYAKDVIPGGAGNKQVTLPDDLCESSFRLIVNAARSHRKAQPDSELVAVHSLFPQFAVTRSVHSSKRLALIDVEVRFGRAETDPTTKASMIDLAFLLPDHRVLFVEAKCIGNPSIISRGEAPVVKQVSVYERHIQRPGVLKAINRSLTVQSNLVGRPIEHAIRIIKTVPILILNPSMIPNPVTRDNNWLRQALRGAPDWTPGSTGVGIIDGTVEPINAIHGFVSRFGSMTS